MNELAAAAATDSRSLQLILVDSIAAACQDDLALAARSVDHLQFLAVRQNKGQGWDFSKMGTNLASYLVQTVPYLQAPKEQRIQQLIKILRDPWIATATAQQADLLHEFCGARIFTHRKMVEAAPPLLKECPRGGRTARELAAMAWQTNQRPKAVEFLEAARQAATAPELQAQYAVGAQTLTP